MWSIILQKILTRSLSLTPPYTPCDVGAVPDLHVWQDIGLVVRHHYPDHIHGTLELEVAEVQPAGEGGTAYTLVLDHLLQHTDKDRLETVHCGGKVNIWMN